MFDSHCHLTDVAEPLRALEEALAAGVSSVLSCGYDAESNAALHALRASLPSLPVAIGLHPWFADQDVGSILAQVRADAPAAIGELGLDFWSDPPVHPRERQLEVLEAQLDLAASLALPVTLHSRKAVADLDGVLKNHPRVRGVLHAFGGSREQAARLFERGFLIGVGGGITRPRAQRLRRTATELPLDALLLETDSPAIGMDIVAPPDVRPRHVRRVAEVLAELRGISVEQVILATDENAVRMFGDAASFAARSQLGEELGRILRGTVVA